MILVGDFLLPIAIIRRRAAGSMPELPGEMELVVEAEPVGAFLDGDSGNLEVVDCAFDLAGEPVLHGRHPGEFLHRPDDAHLSQADMFLQIGDGDLACKIHFQEFKDARQRIVIAFYPAFPNT